jgi:DNA-binding LacI/PurR family transcriptional regulator
MDITVSKDSSVPLHIQLLNDMRHRILSREWMPGSRVPSENTLVSLLGISRSTIRLALHAAKAESLIASVAGKGTFVSATPGKQVNSHLIGFIIPYFRSSFDSQLLRGAEAVLRAQHYRVLFCNSERQVAEENRLLHLLIQDHAAGILIWPVMDQRSRRVLFDLVHQHIPITLLDRTFPKIQADAVLCENFNGGYAATQHLIALGHRKIVFMARPHLNLLPIAERLRGYRQAMRDARLKPCEPLLIGAAREISTDYALRSYTNANGEDIQQLRKYLKLPNRATAIFAMNDLMALQVLRAAELAHVRVPQELSIVGFDDMDFASHLETPLTTIAQDPFALGQEAARVLLQRIAKPSRAPRQFVLPTHLVVRKSTAPPKNPSTP